ncbi:MarR family transcriptional regulator [Microbacterium sp. zg-YB36]|uniref:MarR family winged helix-turn-helix transcriptional regulator n=1 Tax=Microbacterium sp. zg-YB36 TaxID=2969407 RepID=UPI00214CE214|nr:MarR family transcriptional regulator [Microbacterium sp. zg-YB36]MDL5352443.1 MarR family transcriptional regulator [Microbacterium sp. zg-YB36]
MSTGPSRTPHGDDLGRQLSTAVVLFHQAVAARVGLSAGDLKTLELIESEGPFSASELAERTGLTGAGITNVISRLAGGGHIERQIDPQDRRRAIIRATPENNLELEDAFAHLGMSLGAVIGEYNATEQAAITSYLQRMVHVLREETQRLGMNNPDARS